MTVTRPISWIKAARKTFDAFPSPVQTATLRALTIAAEGQKSDNAKPLSGLGAGVWEIVLRYRTDAYRVVYATQIGCDLWVVPAFPKKSKSGIKTPKMEMAVIEARIKRLREMLA